MELKKTLKTSTGLYLAGVLAYVVLRPGYDEALWFAVSGGLALVNIFFAAWTIRFGFKSTQNKGLFLGLLLFKSMTFLMVVLVVLMFLKPLLLPFTLGISVVIVGAVGAALYEVGPLLKRT
jgi:hypothetical protein